MKFNGLKAIMIQNKLFKVEIEDAVSYFIAPDGRRILKKNIISVTPEGYGICDCKVHINYHNMEFVG